jgi:hypothetical protein
VCRFLGNIHHFGLSGGGGRGREREPSQLYVEELRGDYSVRSCLLAAYKFLRGGAREAHDERTYCFILCVSICVSYAPPLSSHAPLVPTPHDRASPPLHPLQQRVPPGRYGPS